MKQVGCLLLLSLAIYCCATNLPKGVTPIFSVDAYYPNNSDLREFDELAGRAEIFAIGESAHGVAGYQDFQFRLTKYLITNHKYRIVLLEILSDDRALNTYLTTGQGNLTQILYYNPWQGSDIQMYNFFSWIRSFNVKHPHDMVHAYAPDPQKPWEDAPVVRAFLEAYDQKYDQNFTAELFSAIYANCYGAKFDNQVDWAYSPEASAYSSCGCLPEDETNACVGSVVYLEDMIRSERKSLDKWLGYTYVEDVLYALRGLHSWQLKSATLYTQPAQGVRYREAVFGQNVLWLASRDNPRRDRGTVFLAHNLHIAKTTLLSTFLGPNPSIDPFTNIHPVGFIVHENIGDKYVAVAQSGYQVSPMFGRPYPIPTSPLSIDVTLQALNHSYLLLDTRAPWVKEQGVWLTQEESVPNGRYYNLEESFDKLVFQSVAPKGVFINGAAPSNNENSAHVSRMVRSVLVPDI